MLRNKLARAIFGLVIVLGMSILLPIQVLAVDPDMQPLVIDNGTGCPSGFVSVGIGLECVPLDDPVIFGRCFAIADDDSDSDSDSDANEVSVEVTATNEAGYKLKVEVEGTGLGFINVFAEPPVASCFGGLTGEAELTDPLGNECEVEIVKSNNGIEMVQNGVIARLSLFNASNVVVISIGHNDSMSVTIPSPGKFEFVGDCSVVPPVGPDGPILFPGDRTEVEIEEG